VGSVSDGVFWERLLRLLPLLFWAFGLSDPFRLSKNYSFDSFSFGQGKCSGFSSSLLDSQSAAVPLSSSRVLRSSTAFWLVIIDSSEGTTATTSKIENCSRPLLAQPSTVLHHCLFNTRRFSARADVCSGRNIKTRSGFPEARSLRQTDDGASPPVFEYIIWKGSILNSFACEIGVHSAQAVASRISTAPTAQNKDRPKRSSSKKPKVYPKS